MDKGKLVLIRSTLNQPVVRRLWSENDGKVVICREESFAKWEEVKIVPRGVEIPKTDVFIYDSELFERMKVYDQVLDDNPKELEELWKLAKPLFD